jgi:electron-transferring-flavoprotein dehydrogenase
MLAAETLAEALHAERCSAELLQSYAGRYQASWLFKELHLVRNIRQAFQSGLFFGMLRAGAMLALRGRIVSDRVPVKADAAHMERLASRVDREAADSAGGTAPIQGLTMDKLTGVFHAGAMHEENQPSHLLVQDINICATRCREEFGNPCEHFCPARVYEMVDGGSRLQINHSNCVHCKTCDVMDPYGIITWTVPGDAGGPMYLGL